MPVAFYALAVGTSPTDATVIQNNMAPLHEPVAVTAARRTLELPSVAVDLDEGENLSLVASPLLDMFVGTNSLQPGTVTLDQASLRIPVQ